MDVAGLMANMDEFQAVQLRRRHGRLPRQHTSRPAIIRPLDSLWRSAIYRRCRLAKTDTLLANGLHH